MIALLWDLSDVRETRRLNGQRNTEPYTVPGCGTISDVRGRPQGHLIKESNQDFQIAFPLPLYPVVFFSFSTLKYTILITLKLKGKISTAKSLNLFCLNYFSSKHN